MINDRPIVYPIVLKATGSFWDVQVPDLNLHFRSPRKPVIEVIQQAQRQLAKCLYDLPMAQYPALDENKLRQCLDADNQNRVVYVTVDPQIMRQQYSKTIRKNITIPQYLNDWAVKNQINFSQVLTHALEHQFEQHN